MKRLLLTVLAIGAMLLCADKASAQVEGLGIIGGFTSSSSNVEALTPESISEYHAGLTFKYNVGLGLAIQPSIVYQVKGTDLKTASEISFLDNIQAINAKVGYVEVPVQIQWGPDLMAFRPYVFGEPFVGYAVNFEESAMNLETIKNEWENANISRLEYGVGVGAGIEIWHLQLSAKYFWNFGSLCDDEGKIDTNVVSNAVTQAFKDKKNFNGISVSLALFF